MILIADSGSTQTKWAMVAGEATHLFRTPGMNPYYQTEAEMEETIRRDLLPQLPPEARIEAIYFYGAGCAFPEKNRSVERAIRANIPARVMVRSDLWAAALAPGLYLGRRRERGGPGAAARRRLLEAANARTARPSPPRGIRPDARTHLGKSLSPALPEPLPGEPRPFHPGAYRRGGDAAVGRRGIHALLPAQRHDVHGIRTVAGPFRRVGGLPFQGHPAGRSPALILAARARGGFPVRRPGGIL